MTLNASASLRAKLDGQQLVLDIAGDWRERAMDELRHWLDARCQEGIRTMTMEVFRHAARHQPASHMAWGALATLAKNAGLLRPLGYVKARSVRTHAHPVMRWEIVK